MLLLPATLRPGACSDHSMSGLSMTPFLRCSLAPQPCPQLLFPEPPLSTMSTAPATVRRLCPRGRASCPCSPLCLWAGPSLAPSRDLVGGLAIEPLGTVRDASGHHPHASTDPETPPHSPHFSLSRGTRTLTSGLFSLGVSISTCTSTSVTNSAIQGDPGLQRSPPPKASFHKCAHLSQGGDLSAWGPQVSHLSTCEASVPP